MSGIPSTNTCLFVVYEAGNVLPAIRLLTQLCKETSRRGVVFCPYYLPDTENYRQLAAEAGLVYVHSTTALGGGVDVLAHLRDHFGLAEPQPAELSWTSGPRRRSWRAWATDQITRRLSPEQREQVDEHKRIYTEQIDFARELVVLMDVDVCLLPEENVERDSWAWIRAVHEAGGVALVVSYAVVTPEEAFVAYADDPAHAIEGRSGKMFSALLPHWTKRHDGKKLSRLPIERALALEAVGVTPKHPWTVNTGDADAIVLESQFMLDQFAKHGVERRRMFALGHPMLDAVAEEHRHTQARRDELYRELGLDGDRRLAVCALPPDQFELRPALGFASYMELAHFWLETLTATDRFDLVATPHPSLAGDVLDQLEARGYRIMRGATVRLIPISDLYVASVSTTIKWARACGKPVIDYDCYGYGYEAYLSDPAIKAVTRPDEFSAAVEEMDDPRAFGEFVAAGEHGAEYWGKLDGLSMQRIVSLISELLARRTKSRPGGA